MQVLLACLSNIQFAFFSYRAGFLKHQMYDGKKQAIDLSGLMRTDCNAAHAGNTGFLIHFCRITRTDGPDRTFGNTDTAFRTGLGCFGYDTRISGLSVRPVARYGRSSEVSFIQLVGYLIGKRFQMLLVGLIRTARGIFVRDGVFCYRCDSGYNREPEDFPGSTCRAKTDFIQPYYPQKP